MKPGHNCEGSGAGRSRTPGVAVSEALPRPVGLTPVPGLSELQADRAILALLPLDVLLDLPAQVGHVDVDLDIAISHQMARHNQPRQPEAESDRLISLEVAATRFGVKRRWLLDHANESPGRRQSRDRCAIVWCWPTHRPSRIQSPVTLVRLAKARHRASCDGLLYFLGEERRFRQLDAGEVPVSSPSGLAAQAEHHPGPPDD
jgi:hypothetical protein